ncbi:uncharacterized protein LOC103859009 [Brassica rapa]|uniref:Uncharacterized protein n=2 Tax=Brassica TaxID=3705 RepID=A0ABQ8DYN5_BRANA|nr:uncharacterized protein LOC103859009 [Brassica rapa]XP_013740882.1 uncharacterized protein LOC106443876 [Brassica napus]KAH0933803.1 hypothetical protein HID58_010920 [Brassica napus]
MASSKASYMLVSLLLVLVLADMDKALGEQIQLRNSKFISLLKPPVEKALSKIFGAREKELAKYFKKVQDAAGAIPPPPPSPACKPKDDECKGKVIKLNKQNLSKQINDLLKKLCKPNGNVCNRKNKLLIEDLLKKACKPNNEVVCKINFIKRINDFLKKAKSPPSP